MDEKSHITAHIGKTTYTNKQTNKQTKKQIDF